MNPPSTNRGRLPRRASSVALPPGAPPRSADPKEIEDYIKSNRICFQHARGEVCEKMAERGFCSFSHDLKTLPHGAYPRTSALNALDVSPYKGLLAVLLDAKPAPSTREAPGAGQHDRLLAALLGTDGRERHA